MKPIMIPRLGLLSALLLARLLNTVDSSLRKDLDFKQPVCFTDSKIALAWIKHTEHEWKQFVENRVTQIRNLIPNASWHHCSGAENPADIPSRGLSPREFQGELSYWLKGPGWLRETLPNPQDSDELPEGCIDEAWNKQGDTVSMSVITTPSRIIRVENYSLFRKLHRVVGQVFRFVRILQNPHAPHADKELSVSDL